MASMIFLYGGFATDSLAILSTHALHSSGKLQVCSISRILGSPNRFTGLN